MPDRARFFDTPNGTREENFYAVLWHELTHWTGHPTRCDRDLRMFNAIAEICDLYSPEECWNYFTAAGYVSG